MPFPSEHLTGVTHDDSGQLISINTSLEPWLTFFSQCDPLTANNTEQYDAAFLLALEQACNGKDADLDSPVGRGQLPFDGIENSVIVRSDGTDTEVQQRKQIYLAVYAKQQTFNPNAAVNNED